MLLVDSICQDITLKEAGILQEAYLLIYNKLIPEEPVNNVSIYMVVWCKEGDNFIDGILYNQDNIWMKFTYMVCFAI